MSRPLRMMPIRVAISWARKRSWVAISTAAPPRAASRTSSWNWLAASGSKPGQRLVEEQRPGVLQERHGQADLLAHPLGVGLGATRGGVRREPDPVESSAAARPDRLGLLPLRSLKNARFSIPLSLG